MKLEFCGRFDPVRVDYVANLYFGLSGMNVTVSVHEPYNMSNTIFVEHIPWQTYYDRNNLVRSFLERGVVNPILTVIDYYSAPGELCMGTDLRYGFVISLFFFLLS
jgi:hypothetical protein